MKFKSFDKIKKYSNSCAEPKHICKKRLKSVSESLPHPSLKLEGIEYAALYIWETNWYFSDWGNEEVKS